MKISPVGAEFSMRTERHRDRQTDRHDEANSRLSQLCECAYQQSTKISPSV